MKSGEETTHATPPGDRPRFWRQWLRAAMAATLPRRLFLVRGPSRSRAVCLTFDDGPHPDHTPRLLDALRGERIPATFFVVGTRAEKHPDLVRRIVEEGHSLGGHSFHHTPPERTSAGQLLEETLRTRRLLRELTGREASLMRPPHGKVTAAKLGALWRTGNTIVLWNVDLKDFESPSAGDVLARVDARAFQGGDIVLMHDNHPHGAQVLPRLAEAVRSCGLGFTTPEPWVGRS